MYLLPGQPSRWYALSIKQPWAALILHGLKTIEIRKWPTNLRGPILLHAAKVDDERPEGWELLPKEYAATAELRGGIIGKLKLIDCRAYATPAEFEKDAAAHRNLPEWFEPPRMFGFVFAEPEPLPLALWPGNVRFFTVPLDELKPAGEPAT